MAEARGKMFYELDSGVSVTSTDPLGGDQLSIGIDCRPRPNAAVTERAPLAFRQVLILGNNKTTRSYRLERGGETDSATLCPDIRRMPCQRQPTNQPPCFSPHPSC